MAGSSEMILCDVGNSRMHFFREGRIWHLDPSEGLARYRKEKVAFISVNPAVTRRIRAEAPGWRDLESFRCLPTAYRGLGIDREAACLGVGSGIVIDAGSAVTVDRVRDGRHEGGWIWPGIAAWERSCAAISPALAHRPDPALLPKEGLPLTTEAAIAYGLFGAVAATVAAVREGLPVVVTGGDAAKIAAVIPEATVDETVVFKGMLAMIEESKKG